MKNTIFLTLSIVTSIFLCNSLIAQEPAPREMYLTFNEAIRIAQGETPDKVLAETRLENNYWQYNAFKGGFKPQLGMSATLPEYSRAIVPVTQPDGTVEYIKQELLNTSVEIGLSQVVAPTGANLFLSTGLRRLDNFNVNGERVSSYLSNPVTLGINQPLFRHNPYKWSRLIEPMKFEEAGKQYNEDMEILAAETVNRYFNLYIAQLDLAAALIDKTNTDSLLYISNGRYKVGTIAETDLLQIELTAMNAESSITSSSIAIKTANDNLRIQLGIRESVNINLAAPPEVPEFILDRQIALEQARLNRSKTVEFRRRITEAEKDVDFAQKENGINVSITGSFGLTQTGPDIGTTYNNLLDQERISIGIEVPIADWGYTKSQREIAKSNLQLQQLNVEQEQVDFEMQIIRELDQFELVKKNFEVSEKTYEVAQKKFDITQKRYFVGKIGTLDLNNSLLEKETARKSYLQSLRAYWNSYYRIRNLTLYDFVDNAPIYYEKPISLD